MKKIFSTVLAACLLLSLTACGKAAPQEAAEPESMIQQTETQPEATAARAEGELYLSVSALDFSLVGESEDIYAGSLPREVITWQSGDPTVVTFENGVLTAVGKGSTTVSALYEGQKAEVPVSVLAGSREELMAMDLSVLRRPKRLPGPVSDAPATCFGEAALIGDSISYILFQNEAKKNDLGDMLFMTRGGVSINSLVVHYKELRYQGQDGHIEDLIRKSGVRQIFIMLGQNDLGYMSLEDTMKNLDIMMERILEKSPNLEVYLESVLPEFQEGKETIEKNILMDQYNEAMQAYAAEKGFHYVDIQKFVEDHCNNMAEGYHMDERHMNYEGCSIWMQALKSYMHMEQLKGE